MSLSLSLKNKIVLITGGYGHLGKGIVESLFNNEAKVYVLGRRKEKFEEAFKGYLPSNRLYFQPCDISFSNELRKVFKKIHEVEGRIDVLINNAFYLKGQSPETMSEEDFAFGLDGTLTSVFRAIKEIIPFFKEQGNGSIINVSSMYGLVAPDFSIYEEFPQFLNPPHYGAAKAGVLQLTRYYANYLGRWNIRVNTISPGPFPADEVQINEAFVMHLASHTSLKRIGKPEDLAGVFVFLASDASSYITGQNIVVDGGWTIT